MEAAAQILANKPNSKIIITAQSNSACDEIATRLLKFIPRTKIFRYFTPAVRRDMREFNENLKSISNLRNNRHEFPTYEELHHFSVVIVTLVTAKRIQQADLKSHHFEYIFIDESGCAVEPECLIPIAGIWRALIS